MEEPRKPNLSPEGKNSSSAPESELVLRIKKIHSVGDTIDAALNSGDFALAQKLQQDSGMGEEVAVQLFFDYLEGRDDESLEKAVKMTEVLKISTESVEELVVDAIGKGLAYGYVEEAIPYGSKYFSITDKMKIAAGKRALELAKNRTGKLKEITEYFLSLGIDISS